MRCLCFLACVGLIAVLFKTFDGPIVVLLLLWAPRLRASDPHTPSALLGSCLPVELEPLHFGFDWFRRAEPLWNVAQCGQCFRFVASGLATGSQHLLVLRQRCRQSKADLRWEKDLCPSSSQSQIGRTGPLQLADRKEGFASNKLLHRFCQPSFLLVHSPRRED